MDDVKAIVRIAYSNQSVILSVLVAGGEVSLVYEEEVAHEAVECGVTLMNDDVRVFNDNDVTTHTILSPIRVPFTTSQMKLPTKLLPW